MDNILSMNPCRCCGDLTIEEYDSFEICGNCGWEDDNVQYEDPHFAGGANKMSLYEARLAYRKQV